MKHFIGGWAVGTMFALFYTANRVESAEVTGVQWVTCSMIVGLFFGLAAWGLLP